LELNSEHIDTLITRYLAGEATLNEMKELEAWMDASAENRKYFDGIQFAFNKALASRPVLQFDADRAWNKVHTKMHQQKNEVDQPVKIIPFYQKSVFRIAATFAVLVGLSALIFWSVNRFKTSQPIYVQATENIETQSLPDASKVVVNKNSQIAYSKGFGKTNREVTLKGEAFFDVRHNSVIPFTVKAEQTFIKDIGTSFNIKSYPDSTFIEVFVESGVVMFYTANNPGISLFPGETGIYNKNNDTFIKLNVPEKTTISYINRNFSFDKIRLEDAVAQLNNVYCEQILIDNPEIKDMKISATFENETVENMVNIIAETLGLKVIKTENGWLITNY
jgi:ferric-dicitrate binding protein FerR (iron transport regulator)